MIDWREIGFSVALVVGMFVVLHFLTGCAADKFAGICLVAPYGQTDSGVAALRVQCERVP